MLFRSIDSLGHIDVTSPYPGALISINGNAFGLLSHFDLSDSGDYQFVILHPNGCVSPPAWGHLHGRPNHPGRPHVDVDHPNCDDSLGHIHVSHPDSSDVEYSMNGNAYGLLRHFDVDDDHYYYFKVRNHFGCESDSEVVHVRPHPVHPPHPHVDRKSTRLNSSHIPLSRMPSSA